MSSITVISLIIVLLAGLVCYAFVSQTIQQKREQKKRLLAALQAQARSFKFVLSGCPPGFLTKELTMLVQRNLIDVCEQLARLEPKEPKHLQDVQVYGAALADTQRQPPPSTREPIDNPQKVKEIKMSLEELHRYIFKMEGQQRINRTQADAFRAQIRQLVLQLTVDGYMLNGLNAENNDKIKLALHYFDLAESLMIREGQNGMFDAKIAQANSKIESLKQRMEDEGISTAEIDDNEKEELEGEWGKFSEDDDTWKKKQVYD